MDEGSHAFSNALKSWQARDPARSKHTGDAVVGSSETWVALKGVEVVVDDTRFVGVVLVRTLVEVVWVFDVRFVLDALLVECEMAFVALNVVVVLLAEFVEVLSTS